MTISRNVTQTLTHQDGNLDSLPSTSTVDDRPHLITKTGQVGNTLSVALAGPGLLSAIARGECHIYMLMHPCCTLRRNGCGLSPSREAYQRSLKRGLQCDTMQTDRKLYLHMVVLSFMCKEGHFAVCRLTATSPGLSGC